ncbi:hypothetical protein ASF86_00310 [Acinetobacter sp. Leaf130]|nr:hypothetical protein ASF86_00310 [Acinetobacter sp. Leaf130]
MKSGFVVLINTKFFIVQDFFEGWWLNNIFLKVSEKAVNMKFREIFFKCFIVFLLVLWKISGVNIFCFIAVFILIVNIFLFS